MEAGHIHAFWHGLVNSNVEGGSAFVVRAGFKKPVYQIREVGRNTQLIRGCFVFFATEHTPDGTKFTAITIRALYEHIGFLVVTGEGNDLGLVAEGAGKR